MSSNAPKSFPRRAHSDGSFDLICPTCFRTVGRGTRETELSALERLHQCDTEALIQLDLVRFGRAAETLKETK